MTESLRSLLDFRVIIVTGKGGTGKTTVSAAIADAAQRAGQSVLLAETATCESVAAYFEPRPKPLGFEGRKLRPQLRAIRIDPNLALAEYLGLQIGLRGLAERVLRTKTFHQLLEAIPGWRELIILGKIWHLEQKRNPSGRPEYDLIVVDAPATGHGMTFIDVPRVARQAVRAGPLSRHAKWVESMVHDRDRTLLLPVTLPEELPVLETVEIVNRARDAIDIGVDRVVVNAMPRTRSRQLTPVLEAASEDIKFETLPPISVIREMLIHAERREKLARHERSRVSQLCNLPVVELPFSPSAFVEPEEWTALVECVLEKPAWPDPAEDSQCQDGESR